MVSSVAYFPSTTYATQCQHYKNNRSKAWCILTKPLIIQIL